MAIPTFVDNTYGTLGSGIGASDTTLSLTAGHGVRFPTITSGQVLYATLVNSSNVLEQIHITAHAANSDTLTVTRGANGTTAKAWSAGDRIECRPTSEILNNLSLNIVSVKACGAVGDNVTDDTAAFNAAHVAALAAGAEVYIPGSISGYNLASTVTAKANMRGSGWATNLITSSGTADVIQVTTPGVTLSDFAIKPSVTRTAGYYINSIGVNYTQISRVQCIDWFNAIALTGVGQAMFRATDCWLGTSTAGGSGISIVTSTNSIDVVLKDVIIGGPSSGAQCANGIIITNAGDITLDHISTVHCGVGLNIAPATGQTVQALFCHDSFFDSGSGTGVQFAMSGTGSVQLAKFNNVWSCTNANGFILSANAAGTILRSEFINCTGSNNAGGQGFLINDTGVTNTLVMGGSYSANANGLYANTGVTLFKFLGVTAGACGQFAGNSNVGIVLAGTNDKFTVSDCDFTGNVTLASSIVVPAGGTAGQTWFIKGNQGLATHGKGTGAISSGNTVTTVTHGLIAVPGIQDIALAMVGTTTTFPGNVWIDAIGATTFNVNCTTNPGASGLNFGWQARIWGT